VRVYRGVPEGGKESGKDYRSMGERTVFGR